MEESFDMHGLEILSSREKFEREKKRVNEMAPPQRGKFLDRWIKFLEEKGYVERGILDESTIYPTEKLKKLLEKPEKKPKLGEIDITDLIGVAEWIGKDATRRIFLENGITSVTAREFAELSSIINGIKKIRMLRK